VLQIVSVPLTLVPVILLLVRGLWRPYWPLIGFLCAESGRYYFALLHRQWLLPAELCAGAQWLFAFLLLWRLARRVFDEYPALRAFARQSLFYVVAGAFVAAFVSFLTDPGGQLLETSEFHLRMNLERAIASGMLFFIAVMVGFIAWFPVRMKANVIHLCGGCAYLFVTGWVYAFVSSSSPLADLYPYAVQLIFVAAVSISWASNLDLSGEQLTAERRTSWDPDLLATRTTQLDAIQAVLARRGYS
jgi:hypothetical protein